MTRAGLVSDEMSTTPAGVSTRWPYMVSTAVVSMSAGLSGLG